MTQNTTTISLPKETCELLESFRTIKDSITGVEITAPLSKVVNAILLAWHQQQLERIEE